jgi:hypothetical protein
MQTVEAQAKRQGRSGRRTDGYVAQIIKGTKIVNQGWIAVNRRQFMGRCIRGSHELQPLEEGPVRRKQVKCELPKASCVVSSTGRPQMSRGLCGIQADGRVTPKQKEYKVRTVKRTNQLV